MRTNAFLFPSPQPIMDALEAAFPSQHDRHVQSYKAFKRAYGDAEGYHLAMAERARTHKRMMATAEGRAWILRIENKHSEWRRDR